MTVAVYGASSSRIDRGFVDAAFELGCLLARAGVGIVCGGGRGGLMAAVTDGALSCGGHVTGVLPEFMLSRGWQHPRLSEQVVTSTMHERKATMLGRADGVIALPGGVGTFDELFEAVTWRQLGLWKGPLVILNTLGYYDPMLEMLRQVECRGFMRPRDKSLYSVADTPALCLKLVMDDMCDNR